MQTQSTVANRWNVILVFAVVVAMATAWMVTTDRAGAASAPAATVVPSAPALSDLLALQMDSMTGGDIFAKYDGVDGESDDADHSKWIDVLSVEWGAQLPVNAANSPARGGGAITPTVEGFMLTFGYEKATTKLADKLFKGEIIPKLEVEFTTSFGGSQATYLKYELKNVRLMNYAVVGEADHGQPGVAFVNSFEEIKVRYTEFDDSGKSLGNTEYTYKVGR